MPPCMCDGRAVSTPYRPLILSKGAGRQLEDV